MDLLHCWSQFVSLVLVTNVCRSVLPRPNEYCSFLLSSDRSGRVTIVFQTLHATGDSTPPVSAWLIEFLNCYTWFEVRRIDPRKGNKCASSSPSSRSKESKKKVHGKEGVSSIGIDFDSCHQRTTPVDNETLVATDDERETMTASKISSVLDYRLDNDDNDDEDHDDDEYDHGAVLVPDNGFGKEFDPGLHEHHNKDGIEVVPLRDSSSEHALGRDKRSVLHECLHAIDRVIVRVVVNRLHLTRSDPSSDSDRTVSGIVVEHDDRLGMEVIVDAAIGALESSNTAKRSQSREEVDELQRTMKQLSIAIGRTKENIVRTELEFHSRRIYNLSTVAKLRRRRLQRRLQQRLPIPDKLQLDRDSIREANDISLHVLDVEKQHSSFATQYEAMTDREMTVPLHSNLEKYVAQV